MPRHNTKLRNNIRHRCFLNSAVIALTLTLCRAAILEKQGVPLEGFGRPGELHLRATYESGVLFVLRFMVDSGVVRQICSRTRLDSLAGLLMQGFNRL